MEPTDPRDDAPFIELTYDHEAEQYRQPNGELVEFTKQVTVRIDGEVSTHKLAFTRAWMTVPTARAVPVLRIDGVKHRLDGMTESLGHAHTDFEVSEDSVVPAKL